VLACSWSAAWTVGSLRRNTWAWSSGKALVARNIGGRVTPAVIHHTDCGSRLLEDERLRHGFAERGGYDEQMLAALPVTDPAETVRADVERLLAAPQISAHTRVSGHVYDVETGLIKTVVDPTRRSA
jgi:carbonic anhydrase